MKAEVSKIVIKLKDREIDLSIEEARAIKAELDNLFERAKEYIPYPFVYPSAPIVIERNTWPYRWEVTCGGFHGGNVSQTLLMDCSSALSS